LNPFAQALTGKAKTEGAVFGVRLSRDGVDSWLRKASSGRWELTGDVAKATLRSDRAESMRVYSNMPRVALVELEAGAQIELVRIDYSIEIRARVIKPEPASRQDKGPCDCCGKKLRVYYLKVYDLCGRCYEESCDSKNLPCAARALTKAAREKVKA
jgi:hypothetical protein